MVLSSRDRNIAKGIWYVACARVVRLAGDPASAVALRALENPAPDHVRAFLAIGVGKPWLPSIVDALAEIGVIAAYDILGDGDE